MSTESTRPLLLPQNRKLRHLRGIYLRNLSFIRPRGHSIDDAALNKTSSKLEALRETPQLHHALSTETLRPPAARRRSTGLANASPVTRQKRIEYTFDSRVADAFFSLHVEDEEEPVYISEVEERATNFNFRFFELADVDSSITRSSQVIVKIWTKRQETWSLLLEENVDLRALNWLGSLQNVRFPPNCLVFHLVDGIYSLELSNKYPPPKQIAPLHTSSYNALMKLATLDNSIQDALATRDALTRQINDLLEREPVNELPEAEDKLQLAQKYVGQQRRAIAAAKKRKEELKGSIAARRAAIEQGRAMQEKAAADVDNAAEKLAESRQLVAKINEDIRGQRRRICEDLAYIYNISPVPLGPPLSFQICGLYLPNTTYDSISGSIGGDSKSAVGPVSEDQLSAALGHVALLTDALQYYLGMPLPYPIRPFGSRSSIRDDISQLPDPQREFPLYLPRGGSSAQFRFDYGWFLLNKDIEALCNSQGLKVVDIRHTLPNLKYLLYVCSAGTDEVPERKRGGVRGLWAGRRMKSMGGSVGEGDTSSLGGSSRRGSADSDALSKQRDELHRAIRSGVDGSAESGNGSALPKPNLPFDEGETKLTLRTKGLRENVVR
ncbi:UV radiation resistance associated protein [Diplogelasinospora grovesii]|uniref:Autophagy-related protein 14 n=1 Tax=Diplogelasinospora grovesii TaxID=303347 RepID=A0AAN6N6V0_9PEZI|nr:UV radiation resistance associated protein [Diplogelasinospora grovesii]